MSAQDGGPAFPVPRAVDAEGFVRFHDHGMSMREYYAGKALQGLCANSGGPFQRCERSGWTLVNTTFDNIADQCFELADAMLKARES